MTTGIACQNGCVNDSGSPVRHRSLDNCPRRTTTSRTVVSGESNVPKRNKTTNNEPVIELDDDGNQVVAAADITGDDGARQWRGHRIEADDDGFLYDDHEQRYLTDPVYGYLTARHIEAATAQIKDVDAELARLYGQKQTILVRRMRAEQMIAMYDKRGVHIQHDRDAYAHQQAVIEQTHRDIDRLNAEGEPFEDRYRDERWTRAFLATASNGHVHKTMMCSTCNKDGKMTEFQWLPELSGDDEDAIVDLAGERACTVCYPDAPVAVLAQPTRLFSNAEKDKQKARVEREAKRKEREAKKLIDPTTGQPLRGQYGEFKTERGAELEAMDGVKSMLIYNRRNESPHPDTDRWYRTATDVAHAKAAKHGTDASAEYDSLVARAQKSYKRDYGTTAPSTPLDYADALRHLNRDEGEAPRGT